ncbi:hypothetical protein INS49_013132 [Diaporthe citri]|uniref:uncharacterized protein n=1 Tax=Diaporthe citri TaxID=83186 RepID=UPI001C821B17|nr:uncharacterized protein INS49_013132 [Diaporthe citri]KAG6359610.1 hypothetical protein INS49_013132 [Diaporthe citri]
MPGILPMKVIKVGTSTQSRIAQACDRLQDQRQAEPARVSRGYTESLEERVRVLEAEVRDLKDLLDEKDEKIDMLSKMHGNHRRPSISSGSGMPSNASSPVESRPGREPTPPKEDTFKIQASPLLLGVENSDSYFMGPSSGRGFVEAFKRKLQEAGKPSSDFNTEAFLHIQGCYPLVPKESAVPMRVPPRLFTDRCVNVYFQEWAPLFPVIHKPTFLRIYEEFVSDPEKVKNNHKLAQLHLVFSIAALSSDRPDLVQIASCEQQWQRSVEAVLMENTMNTLQCLVLALVYCTVRADYKRLQHYKGIAVGLSHRLGLHQSQKRFSFGALTIETRKKVFWTLYTLDCFSAAILGLPKLIKEEDAHAEYPSDTDDEYVTEKGFQPTLPGEYTKLSSALALFRAARIMAKVLEKLYPAATSYDLSLQQMSALEAELDNWSENLPQHLKLTFRQDKPSTDVTGSRSPLLSLTYYYIRTLIYRPAIGSSLGHKAAPARLSVSESAKHMIQIAQLLEERSMSFSFCLNKADLLLICGMTLLYQGIDLKQDSKMLKDNERLVNAVIKIVERMKAPSTYDFKRIASMLVSLDEPVTSLPTPPRQSPDTSMAAPPPQRSSPAPKSKKKSSHGHQSQQYPLGRHSGASMSETDLLSQQEKLRRMTMPSLTPVPGAGRPDLHRSASRTSFDSVRPNPASIMQRRDQRLSTSQAAMIARVSSGQKTNLDFLSLGNAASQPGSSSPAQNHHHVPTSGAPTQQHYAPIQVPPKVAAGGVSPSEWEALLGQIDGGQVNLYDAIYGGPQVSLETPVNSAVESSWSPDSLDLSTFNLGDFGGATQGGSLSEESLSSVSGGDDLSSLDLRDFQGNHGAMMPGAGDEGFMMEGMPVGGNFGI